MNEWDIRHDKVTERLREISQRLDELDCNFDTRAACPNASSPIRLIDVNGVATQQYRKLSYNFQKLYRVKLGLENNGFQSVLHKRRPKNRFDSFAAWDKADYQTSVE